MSGSALVQLLCSSEDKINKILRINKSFLIIKEKSIFRNDFFRHCHINSWDDGLENIKVSANFPLLDFLESIDIVITDTYNREFHKVTYDSEILNNLCNNTDKTLNINFGEIFLVKFYMQVNFYFKKNLSNLDLNVYTTHIFLDTDNRIFVHNSYKYYFEEISPFFDKIPLIHNYSINLIKKVKDFKVYLKSVFVVLLKGACDLKTLIIGNNETHYKEVTFVKNINDNLELHEIKYNMLKLNKIDSFRLINNSNIKKVYIQGISIKKDPIDTYQFLDKE